MPTETQSSGLQIHDQIRLDILDGQWSPGSKLSMADLSSRYTTSTTVIREGLTRLAGEKLVAVEPNRGFFVKRLSPEALTDLVELRCRVEAFAIELAVERGDLEWESTLIAAHHRLSRTPRRDEGDPTQISREWERAHRAFHGQLLSASGLDILDDTARQLSDSIEVYRRWAARSMAAWGRDVEVEHREILDAVVARDGAAAAAKLRAHYEGTLAVLLASGVVTEQTP